MGYLRSTQRWKGRYESDKDLPTLWEGHFGVILLPICLHCAALHYYYKCYCCFLHHDNWIIRNGTLIISFMFNTGTLWLYTVFTFWQVQRKSYFAQVGIDYTHRQPCIYVCMYKQVRRKSKIHDAETRFSSCATCQLYYYTSSSYCACIPARRNSERLINAIFFIFKPGRTGMADARKCTYTKLYLF